MKIVCAHGDEIYVKPDTALLRENRPFYLPRGCSEITYRRGVIVRLDRVGKSIETRFAHRYYHEIGTAIEFVSDTIPSWADQSLAVSPEFVPITAPDPQIDTLIHRISQFMTLKMGDLVFISRDENSARIGDRLSASLDGKKLLDFEIK